MGGGGKGGQKCEKGVKRVSFFLLIRPSGGAAAMRLPMVVVSKEALSPAATVRAGRESRTPFPKSLQVGAHDASSDEEWDPEEEGSEDEDGRVGNAGRGRVRLHAMQMQTASGLDDEDDRRKCLADQGWARRSVVIRGVGGSGAANLEALPGREDYPAGDDGDAQWAEAMLQFQDDNFEGAGTEVRSMDQRDRKVGLFGDFLERVGHGKFVEWRANEEHYGLHELKVVTKVGAARHA